MARSPSRARQSLVDSAQPLAGADARAATLALTALVARLGKIATKAGDWSAEGSQRAALEKWEGEGGRVARP